MSRAEHIAVLVLRAVAVDGRLRGHDDREMATEVMPAFAGAAMTADDVIPGLVPGNHLAAHDDRQEFLRDGS